MRQFMTTVIQKRCTAQNSFDPHRGFQDLAHGCDNGVGHTPCFSQHPAQCTCDHQPKPGTTTPEQTSTRIEAKPHMGEALVQISKDNTLGHSALNVY